LLGEVYKFTDFCEISLIIFTNLKKLTIIWIAII